MQNQNLRQLQNDRIALKRQEMEYYRKGNSVPVILKDRIKYNADNITTSKNLITSYEVNYKNTQTHYDDIIGRLKKLE